MRVLVWATFAALTVSSAFAADCALQPIAAVPFQTDETAHIFFPAKVASRPTRLMLDTGAFWSGLRSDLAKELNLKTKTSWDVTIVDAAGNRENTFVTVPDASIGDLPIRGPVDFVLMAPDDAPIEEYGGVLGLNLLTRVDMEIDNVARVVTFYRQDHCKGAGVHWTKDYVTLSYKRDFDVRVNYPIFDAEIDGESIKAVIDTGATFSGLSADFARRHFGITRDTPGAKPAGHVTTGGGEAVDTFSYTFKSLTISGHKFGVSYTFENVPVLIGEFDSDIGLLLGMNEIKQLRIYWAFKERKIHITPANAGR